MAGPNTPDELNIGMGVEGDDEVADRVKRVERIFAQAAQNIDQAFADKANVTKKLTEALLGLERLTVSLTRQFAGLGRAGAEGFEEIQRRQIQSLESLTKVQNKLRELDIEASKPGVRKTRLAEIQKESKDLVNQLGLLSRELLGLQQLDIVLKAKILPKVDETPIKLTSLEEANAQFNSLDRAILGFQERLTRITKLQGSGTLFDNIVGDSKTQLSELKTLEAELEAIRKAAAQADEVGLTNLVEDSELLKALLKDIEKEYLDIKRRQLDLPDFKQPKIDVTTYEDALKVFNRLDKAILGYQEKFTKVTKLQGEGTIFKDLIDDSQIELKNLELLQRELEKLRKASGNADSEGLSKLVKDSEIINILLRDIEESLISIKRRQVTLPEVAKPTLERPYTGDIDLERALRNQNKSAFQLEKNLNELSRKTYPGAFKFTAEAAAAEQQVKALTDRILQLQRVAKQTQDKDIISELNLEAKETQKQLNAVEDRLIDIKRTQLSYPDVSNGKKPGDKGSVLGNAVSTVADVFNVPGLGAGLTIAGGAAALTYGFSKFVEYSKLALDKTVEQIQANRLLASSAIEAGIGIQALGEKNKAFASLVGINEVVSAQTVAKVAQLTTRSKQPESIDRLLKGFADLGAARGLDPEELKTIVQQIITGQDEGYKKLGLANPSQIFQDYGRKQGRSAESFSSVERAQIFQTEFLKKADIFAGAAEARINSLDGAVSKLYSSFDNLSYGIAKAVATAPDVAVLIDDITASVKGLTGSLDDLGRKQALGQLTDKDIAEASKPGWVDYFRSLLKNTGPVKLFYEGGFSEDARDPGSLNEEALRRRLNAQLKVNVDNDRIGRERQVEIAREQAEEDKRQLEQKEIKRYNDLFKKKRDNPDELVRAIAEIQNYQETGTGLSAPGDIEKRVTDAYAKLKPEDFARYAQIGFADPESIKKRFREQFQEEAKAAAEILGQPLFDEQTKENLIERAQQDLSAAVQKAYKRVLDDPHIRIETVLKTIGQIKSDQRIFPEVEEALEREAKAIQERMQKLSEELYTVMKQNLVESATSITGNPLIKQLNDIADAVENTRKKFAPWGKEFANTMAEITKATALRNLEVTLFQLSDRALKLRQESNRLAQLPDTQTDAFARRLDQVEKSVEFAVSDSRLSRQASESKYYAETFSPSNAKSYLLDKYGYTGLDRLTQDFQPTGRNRNESNVDYQRRINEERERYLQTSLKIRDAVEDIARIDAVSLEGTGIYGQEAQAKARLDRLPSRDELLPRLFSYGQTREEAQNLLKQRAQSEEILREANARKYKDYIENQRFLDQNRKDADERLANIPKYGLNDRDKIEQYLAITGEIGNAELTPQQRQGRIKALNQLATITEESRKEAALQLRDIAKTMGTVNDQLIAKGLKVDLGEQAITEVYVSSDLDYYKRDRRPSQSDTNSEY